jgi:hypothetical protein
MRKLGPEAKIRINNPVTAAAQVWASASGTYDIRADTPEVTTTEDFAVNRINAAVGISFPLLDSGGNVVVPVNEYYQVLRQFGINRFECDIEAYIDDALGSPFISPVFLLPGTQQTFLIFPYGGLNAQTGGTAATTSAITATIILESDSGSYTVANSEPQRLRIRGRGTAIISANYTQANGQIKAGFALPTTVA